MKSFITQTTRLAPFIVDAHQHIGSCRVFDYPDQTAEDLIKNMDEKGIDVSIVQPFPGAFPQPARAEHDRIARMAEKYPGRIFGMCSSNPHVIKPKEWVAEIERCVHDLGFVAVKLHTIGHGLSPMCKDGMRVFETANRLGIAVMVHTGIGGQMCAPTQVIPAAKKWPDLPIILGHAGFPLQTPDAVNVASLMDNIYLETSWCMGDDIVWAVRELGVEKVMFGSDLLNNTMTELVKAEESGLTKTELEGFFAQTALKVFKLPLSV